MYKTSVLSAYSSYTDTPKGYSVSSLCLLTASKSYI